MAENTKIQWTDHTFNPWRSCEHAKLPDGSEHPGCANCYAEAMSRRNPKTLGVWGANGTRVVAAEAQWKAVELWDHEVSEAGDAGERRRVFCASLADVFEDWQGKILRSDGTVVTCPVSGIPIDMNAVRRGLFALIDRCQNLDFLLVTKRPENVRKFWPQMAGTMVQDFGRFDYRQNVWLLTSVSDQQTADAMIPELLACRDLCPVLGLSIEPLLGPVTLNYLHYDNSVEIDCLHGTHGLIRPHRGTNAKVDWVIVGGESGPGARPCRVDWIRDIVKQCRVAGVACFVKQVGQFVIDRNDAGFNAEWNDGEGWSESCEVEHNIHGFREEHQGADCRIRTRDPKGGDPAEWPDDLRVRQFPEVPQ